VLLVGTLIEELAAVGGGCLHSHIPVHGGTCPNALSTTRISEDSSVDLQLATKRVESRATGSTVTRLEDDLSRAA
jgi:hypothetical protein